MKKESIKYHLNSSSILTRRRSTINHAFASALAPTDLYNEERLKEALRILNQSPDEDLYCVYCDRFAETWDHVAGLVKGTKFSGFGHQIGNLVPCCKECNSQKGNKDWKSFLAQKVADVERRKEKERSIEEYVRLYIDPIDLESLDECQIDLREYTEIKEQIFS